MVVFPRGLNGRIAQNHVALAKSNVLGHVLKPSPSIVEPETISTDSSLAGLNCTGEYTQVKACNEQKC